MADHLPSALRLTQSKGAAGIAALFFAVTLGASPAHAEKLEGVEDKAREGDIVFSMQRKGKDIGSHSITFKPLEDGRLQVDVAINIKVKFAFITAYRYEHLNTEIWSADGKTLLAIETQTHNNGDDISVNGKRDGDVFEMTDEDGKTYTVSGSIVPTSYWNPILLGTDSAVLNTQKGVIIDASFRPVGDSSVSLDEAAVQTTVYESQGKLKGVTTQYTPDTQCWVGLEFLPPKQDVKISYTLERFFADKRDDLDGVPMAGTCQSTFDTDEETSNSPAITQRDVEDDAKS